MKNTLIIIFFGLVVLCPKSNFAQAALPDFGRAASFGLFTNAGAVSNVGTSTINGNIGTQAGAISGYNGIANVSGALYQMTDPYTLLVALDVIAAHTFLLNSVTDDFIGAATVMGSAHGQTLVPKVYEIVGELDINDTLVLDGKGNPNSIFIFKVNGVLNSNGAKMVLANGATAANVFWETTGGAVNITANSVFIGTIISDGAIGILDGASVSGSCYAIAGAITTTNSTVSSLQQLQAATSNITVSAKAYLQGAFNSNGMTGMLATKGLIPLAQPYGAPPYNHITTSLESSITIVPFGVTDWVLVELLDVNNVVVGSRAVFIDSDGNLMDVDGTSGVKFPTSSVPIGNYNLGIRHRNHLAVRTATPIPFTAGANTIIDFTTGFGGNIYTDSNITANSPMMLINNVYTMWAGDACGKGAIRYTGPGNAESHLSITALGGDLTKPLLNVYHACDLNLKGSVRYIGPNNDEGFLSINVLGGNLLKVIKQHY